MAKRLNQIAETTIARAVVGELQQQGYETHEEVQAGGGRADVVGLRGPLVVVVECKVSMSLAVLSQCLNWVGRANLIIAATGFSRRNDAAFRFMKWQGFGHWQASEFGDYGIKENLAPRLHRLRLEQGIYNRGVRQYCCEDTKSGGEFAQGGTDGGGYYTPFRGTCKALRSVVRKEPGIRLKDALGAMQHHYASSKSAMSSLPGLIRKGVVDGVRLEIGERGALMLYPVPPPALCPPDDTTETE